jgi:hypothetical protein
VCSLAEPDGSETHRFGKRATGAGPWVEARYCPRYGTALQFLRLLPGDLDDAAACGVHMFVPGESRTLPRASRIAGAFLWSLLRLILRDPIEAKRFGNPSRL